MSVDASGPDKSGSVERRMGAPRLQSRHQGEHPCNHHKRRNFEELRPSSFPRCVARLSYTGGGSWLGRDLGLPPPYFQPVGRNCPYRRPERRTQTCVSSEGRVQSSSPTLLPSFGPETCFGSGFCKGLDESLGRESSLGFECVDGGSAPADTISKGSGAHARRKAAKRSRPEETSPTPFRTRVPTLVEMHKNVIDSALRGFSRPREGPFQNLGERLGGERENFTYCDKSIRLPRGSNAVAFGETEQQRLLSRHMKKPRKGSETTSGISTCAHNADRERIFRCSYSKRVHSSKTNTILCESHVGRRATDGYSGVNRTERDVDESNLREHENKGESNQAMQSTLPPTDTCHTSLIPHCRSREMGKSVDASDALKSKRPCRLRAAVKGSEAVYHSDPTHPSHPSTQLPSKFARTQITHNTARTIRRTKPPSRRVETKVSTRGKARVSIESKEGPESIVPPGQNDHANLHGRVTDLCSTRESDLLSPQLSNDLDNTRTVFSEEANGRSSGQQNSDGKQVDSQLDRDAILFTVDTLAATSRVLVENCVSRALSFSASWSAPTTFLAMTRGRASRPGSVATLQRVTSNCVGESTMRVLAASCPPLTEVEPPSRPEKRTVSSGLATESIANGTLLAFSAITASRGSSAASLSTLRHPVHCIRSDIVSLVAAKTIEKSTLRAMALATKEARSSMAAKPAVDARGIVHRQSPVESAVGARCLVPEVNASTVPPLSSEPNGAHECSPETGVGHLGWREKDAAGPELPSDLLSSIRFFSGTLRPVLTPRSTRARCLREDAKPRRICAEMEAAEQATALMDLENLVRIERLERNLPASSEKDSVFGEGKHSVVYRLVPVATFATHENRKTPRTPTRVATAPDGTMVREEVRGMAKVMTESVFTIAIASVLSGRFEASGRASWSEEAGNAGALRSCGGTATPYVPDIDSGQMKTFAAKEFRYLRAKPPAVVLRNARREASMHLRVSDCERVVALHGLWIMPRVTLVLEAMDAGDLYRFVREYDSRGATREKERRAELSGAEGTDDSRRLSQFEAARLVAQAADGLSALHRAGIVHRDVKSHNVMIRRQPQSKRTSNGERETDSDKGTRGEVTQHPKGEWEAKLGDLGSAALTYPVDQTKLKGEAGTSGWVAPEVLGGEGYGTSADIFGLGVLIWDTFVRGTLDNPLCGLTGQACWKALRNGLRPPLRTNMPPEVADLIERCWAFEASERPAAELVATELRAFAGSRGSLARDGVLR